MSTARPDSDHTPRRGPGRRRSDVADSDRDQTIRTLGGLAELLSGRPADLAYEAARWTA